MKGYEIIFITDPNTTEEEQQVLVDKVKEVFTQAGGEVVHQTNWGRRKLAYMVKKFEYGYYHVFYVSRSKEAVKEMEDQFRFNAQVIKWHTLAVDDLDEEFAAFERLKTEGTIAQTISDRGR